MPFECNSNHSVFGYDLYSILIFHIFPISSPLSVIVKYSVELVCILWIQRYDYLEAVFCLYFIFNSFAKCAGLWDQNHFHINVGLFTLQTYWSCTRTILFQVIMKTEGSWSVVLCSKLAVIVSPVPCCQFHWMLHLSYWITLLVITVYHDKT